MKPSSGGPSPAVLRRVALWSGFLGLTLHLAAVALQLIDGPHPVRRGTLTVIGILFFPMIGSLAVAVAIVAGVWSLVLGSNAPPPVAVGRKSAFAGTPVPTGQRGVTAGPRSSESRSAALGRLGPWSAFLGFALLIAATALQGNPMQRSPLAVAAIPLLSVGGGLALLVAALTGIWRFILSSDLPRPILLGKISLWSGVSGIVLAALPFAAMLALGRSFASQSLLSSPLSQGVLGAVGLASLIALLASVVAGIASLAVSRGAGTANRSGLVGCALGALILGLMLATPVLVFVAYALMFFFGGGRNY